MHPAKALKRTTEKAVISLFAYTLTILISILSLFYFITVLHLVALLIGIPYLIRLSVGGFPLGYYKLTGNRYEYSLNETRRLEKERDYYLIAEIGEISAKQLLWECMLLLIIITLTHHWWATVIRPLFAEVKALLGL